MSLAACLPGLIADGSLTAERAKVIKDQFKQLNAKLAKKMNAARAAELAGQTLLDGLEKKLTLDQLHVVLAVKAQKQGLLDMQAYGDKTGRKPFAAIRGMLGDDDLAPYSNVYRRAETLFKGYQTGLYSYIQRHRRNLAGKIRHTDDLDQMIDAMHGGQATSEHAKIGAKALAEAFEMSRQDFNAAGGNIGRLEGGYFPHRHQAPKVRDAAKGTPEYVRVRKARAAAYKQGRVAEAEALDREMIELNYRAWRDFHLPLLKVEAMRHPQTGAEFDAASLDEAMRGAFETIRTDGMDGLGAADGGGLNSMLAKSRGDHRFFVYKDGAAWRTYAKRFGDPDAFNVAIGHLHGMASDTAMMQRLGPNPPATFRYLMDKAARAQRQSGADADTALFNGMGQEAYTRRLFDVVSGAMDAPVTGPILRYVSRPLVGTRNLVTSMYLGSSGITGLSDFNTQSVARSLSGMPQMTMFSGMLKQLNPLSDADRRLAVELGAGMENATRAMLGLNRYFSDVQDAGWTTVLSDATLRLSLNSAMFEGGQRTFQLDYQRMLGGARDTEFAALDPMLREMMARNGIDGDDWNAIRSSPTREENGVHYADPSRIANRDAADKMMDMIGSEQDRAVQGSSPQARALIGAGKKGTLPEAVMGNVLQFKNFIASLTMTQVSRIIALGPRRGAAYFARFSIGMALSGAVILQLKELFKGNDLRPIDNLEFWGDAILQGGGLGILGDFIGSFDSDRRSSVLGLAAGAAPGMGQAVKEDFFDKGSDDNPDNDLAGIAPFLKSHTPVASSLFYLKVAYNLLVIDTIRELTDPNAADYQRRADRRLEEQDQGRWLGPDGVRAPDFSTIWAGESADPEPGSLIQ